VDPVTGSDAFGDGTARTSAFRSLSKAAEALAYNYYYRSSDDDSSTPSGDATRTVYLAPGVYVLDEPLVLDQAHGNSIWKGLDDDGGGEERRVIVRGGYRIDPSLFQPWRENIVVAFIDDVVGELGSLQSGDLKDCSNAKAEVFYDGQPLTLARYPNIDSHTKMWQWEKIQNVTSDSSFTFAGDRPIWNSYSAAPDMWLHGYFGFDWADNYLRVGAVDEESHTYQIDTNVSHMMNYGLKINTRYYVLNLLEELDSPGEYYIDRKRRLLYLYPPSGTSIQDDAEIIISTIGNLVSARDLSNVTMKGINFSISRGSALSFVNVNNVYLHGGSVTNVGGAAGIQVESSSDVRIVGVEVSRCSCRGIQISGGDRSTLSPSGISVLRNNIHDYGRWKRTYMPAILFEGCGHVVSGNRIYDAPHTGIFGHGNDCVFSYNHLHDLCFETLDCGAFYVGRSWADRGNIVENNLFERIRIREAPTHGYPHAQAIYLDDQMSGWALIDNTFVDVDTGVLIGGGRDNHLIGNTFIRTGLPLYFDKRGLYQKSSSGCTPGGSFEAELKRYNYTQPPWSLRYPELASTFSDRPCAPANNVFRDIKLCPSDTSLWFFSPDTNIAELLLWNNSFSNIVEDSSFCDPSLARSFLVAARVSLS